MGKRRVVTKLERIADMIMLANLRLRIEHPTVEDAVYGALVELVTARYDLSQEIKRLRKGTK